MRIPGASKPVVTLVLCCAVALAMPPVRAAEVVPVRIIAINDLHGHLDPGDNTIPVPHPDDPSRVVPLRSGGAAFLAARVRELRGAATHSVFVSSGDLIGASPLVSALFRDEPTVEAMNLIGLDLNAVGNHEFDRGVAELERLIAGGCATTPRGELSSCAHPSGRYEGARFAQIAANVADADGRTLLAPSWVRDFAGVRVGFIGAVTRSTPGIVMPAGIRGWRFSDEAQAINREARRLQAAGVQALVAVVHEGGHTEGGFNECTNPSGPIFEIARALDPAIDLVLSGHTHRGYVCRLDGRVIIQGASFGRLVSVIDLALDRRTGDVLPDRVRAVNLPVPNGSDDALDPALRRAYPALDADPQVAALIARYRALAAPIASRPIAQLAASFDRRPDAGGDHAAGRLIADAHLAATRTNGAQLAFTNPGGIRGDLVAHPPHGAVSFGDLFAIQPFGNSLVTLTLSGAQLRELLESQWSRRGDRVRILQPSRGFSYAWSAQRPWGERVDPASMQLDGVRIRPDRRYRVTVNDYLAAGGDGFAVLRHATDATGGPLDVEALADHLRAAAAHGPVTPDRIPRIRRLDSLP